VKTFADRHKIAAYRNKLTTFLRVLTLMTLNDPEISESGF